MNVMSSFPVIAGLRLGVDLFLFIEGMQRVTFPQN